jgi:hypothetical protein
MNGERQGTKWQAYISHTLHHSGLYTSLYHGLKDDADIAELLTQIDQDQPGLILFFSIINYLVLRHHDHEFARFYPYLVGTPRPAVEAYPSFRAFCLTYLDEIRSLLSGTRLQTNEPTRCANILPVFELVSAREKRKPLALIELGASAGLNLNWQSYGYEYRCYAGGSLYAGDLDASVQIQCALDSNVFPPLPEKLPLVAQCFGIELYPVDITSSEQVNWLRACIWPEERQRYLTLDAALLVAQAHPPLVLAGDASHLLPDLLASIPEEQTICLWHSFALNQGPIAIKNSIEQTLLRASHDRPIYRISLEVPASLNGGPPRLELFTYRQGTLAQEEWLASCSLHGEHMEWI